MPYDAKNSFTLGKNNKGDNAKRPDYRGEVIIDGKAYKLSGWIRTKGSDGSKFISGSVTADEQAPKSGESKPSQAPAGPVPESDDPF